MSEQHTTGVLRVRGPSGPTADTPEGGDYAILDDKGEIIAEVFARVARGDEGLRPAGANARRIVTCFNAHDDLLSIAELLVALSDLIGAEDIVAKTSSLVIDARAAIAKAGGAS